MCCLLSQSTGVHCYCCPVLSRPYGVVAMTTPCACWPGHWPLPEQLCSWLPGICLLHKCACPRAMPDSLWMLSGCQYLRSFGDLMICNRLLGCRGRSLDTQSSVTDCCGCQAVLVALCHQSLSSGPWCIGALPCLTHGMHKQQMQNVRGKQQAGSFNSSKQGPRRNSMGSL